MRLGYSNCTDEQNTAGAAVIFVKWTNYNSNRESNRFGLLLQPFQDFWALDFTICVYMSSILWVLFDSLCFVSAGASRYCLIIVVVVAGYGYFWWKVRALFCAFRLTVQICMIFLWLIFGEIKRQIYIHVVIPIFYIPQSKLPF